MVRIRDGKENLNPMTEKEEMMGLDPEQPDVRLGCQCRINGGSCDAEIAF
jgi:ferredoxin